MTFSTRWRRLCAAFALTAAGSSIGFAAAAGSVQASGTACPAGAPSVHCAILPSRCSGATPGRAAGPRACRPIPTPSTIALLGLGMIAAGLVGRSPSPRV